MSTPVQFNYPLTEFAINWFRRQTKNPLTFLAPLVKVDAQLGTFKRYPQGNIFREEDTARALYNEANNLDMESEDLPFKLEDHSLRIGVDDTELTIHTGSDQAARDQVAAAKMNTLLGTFSTSFMAQGLRYFRAQIPAVSGVGNWSGTAVGAVTEFKDQIARFAEQNGVKPNRMLIPDRPWAALNNNAETQDLIHYNGARVLTIDLLKQLLEMDGEDLTIMKGIVPIGRNKRGPGVAFEGENLLQSEVWMTYAEDGMSKDDLSGMKTFSTGGEDMLESVESYYERGKKTTWYELGIYRAFVVSAPDAVQRIVVS